VQNRINRQRVNTVSCRNSASCGPVNRTSSIRETLKLTSNSDGVYHEVGTHRTLLVRV